MATAPLAPVPSQRAATASAREVWSASLGTAQLRENHNCSMPRLGYEREERSSVRSA